nr:hypothetical protein [Microbacterium sp. 1.5R]
MSLRIRPVDPARQERDRLPTHADGGSVRSAVDAVCTAGYDRHSHRRKVPRDVSGDLLSVGGRRPRPDYGNPLP